MMRVMRDEETDVHGSSVERQPEESVGFQIDAYLGELLEVRRLRIHAAADTVFDRLVTQLKEQLESEGVDAHQDEVVAAAHFAYSALERRRREGKLPNWWGSSTSALEYTDAVMYAASAAASGIVGNVA